MAYLGSITKTCNSMNQFINKFNVLYDRQGIGRRMRGLFFWGGRRTNELTSTAGLSLPFCSSLFWFGFFFVFFLLVRSGQCTGFWSNASASKTNPSPPITPLGIKRSKSLRFILSAHSDKSHVHDPLKVVLAPPPFWFALLCWCWLFSYVINNLIFHGTSILFFGWIKPTNKYKMNESTGIHPPLLTHSELTQNMVHVWNRICSSSFLSALCGRSVWSWSPAGHEIPT